MMTAPAASSSVLLHCCCAPCAGAVIERLVSGGRRPVVFFSNSNIVPREEYELRKAELIRYCVLFGLQVVDDDYDHGAWLDFGGIRALGRERERGARCTQCFRFRLLRAARYGAEHGIGVLATTLASSRWKDIAQVNEAGQWACAQVPGGPRFWAENWRKGGLQPRRNEIIREQSFYNQTYCGCEFAMRKSPEGNSLPE